MQPVHAGDLKYNQTGLGYRWILQEDCSSWMKSPFLLRVPALASFIWQPFSASIGIRLFFILSAKMWHSWRYCVQQNRWTVGWLC